MMKVFITILALFALCATVMADNRHEMCCHSCHESYTHGHHLKDSCIRGCRLYSMIFLAHDKTIKTNEIGGMCRKSCKKGFSNLLGGADARKACNVGCGHQETVFQKHKADHHVAKMMVLHGLPVLPHMQSLAPFHQRIFQQLRQMHQRMMLAMHNAKAVAVQRVSIRIHSIPPGPDGKPRYHVEIHQFPTKLHALLPHKDGHRGHHDKHGHHHGHHGHHGHMPQYQLPKEIREMYERRHGPVHKIRRFFAHMPHGVKLALRISLCALLVMSLVGLLYLFCSTFRNARPSTRLSLAKAFQKKPSVQSGDIFYVDVDKKPLMEEDELDQAKRAANNEQA